MPETSVSTQEKLNDPDRLSALSALEKKMRDWLSDPDAWEPQEHIIQWADELAAVLSRLPHEDKAETT